jgi:hypothetical protein
MTEAEGEFSAMQKEEDNNYQENEEKVLFTVRDTASILDISPKTIKSWILKHNINKVKINTDKLRVYISYDDVLLLADLHRRKIAHNAYPLNIAEELKEIRSKIKALASEIEDIKHDLRVYVSRSIYIG